VDVLCVGMYRACSTWQYNVVADLVERHRGGTRLGYVTGDAYAALMRRETSGAPWRVLKSHEGHPAFARALAAGRAVAIYAIRDARDVVYSMLHKRRQDFRTFLRQGMVHQLLANHRFWTTFPGGRLLVQRYEQLTGDPTGSVRELAGFLGLALGDGEAAELADEHGFEATRARIDAIAATLRRSGIDLDDPANATRCDERTLLHWNHARTGRAGSWRDRATPVERAVLARLLGRWLALHGYEADHPPMLRSIVGIGPRLRIEADLARGWWTCALRCAALQYPRAGRAAKRLLRIDPPSSPGPHAAGNPSQRPTENRVIIP
jgi:hypothetical protein